MKLLGLLLVTICAFSSCQNSPDYWDTSKFNLVEDALKDGEEIKLLYTSQAPDSNEDREYYVHFVAISEQSGDTINILSTAPIHTEGVSADDVFNYFDQNSLASQILRKDLGDLSDLENLEKKLEEPAPEPKKIIKVVRDPKFDNIADNTHPTVIGSIGKLTYTK